MYIDILMPEYYTYNVIDTNTGIKIPGVQEANDETGEFTIILKDNYDNSWIVDEHGELIVFKFKGNIKIITKEE